MPLSTPISATYRLQFNKDFTFQAASNLLDYLFDLGVTHVYASPIFRSRPGSSHGYDVIDPTRLNPEIGSEADFSLFQEGLRKRGMGLILDVVRLRAGSDEDDVRHAAADPAPCRTRIDPEILRAKEQLLADERWLFDAEAFRKNAHNLMRQESDALLQRAHGR